MGITDTVLTRIRWLALRALVNGDTIAVDVPRRFVVSGVEVDHTTFKWLCDHRYIRFSRLTDVYAITEAGRQTWESVRDIGD